MLTSKRQKFVGCKVLTDLKTGEEYPVQVNVVEDRDFNFHKVWLKNLIMAMEELANQKLSLAFWIIQNLDSRNRLIATFESMSEETGISNGTVASTMRILQKGNPPFLVKIRNGVYQVNPDVLFKGRHSNRMGVCFEYRQNLDRPNDTDDVNASDDEPEPELNSELKAVAD